MHLEYRISLPDHDWVKAERHKLIPSCIAGLIINENGWGRPDAVTYQVQPLSELEAARMTNHVP